MPAFSSSPEVSKYFGKVTDNKNFRCSGPKVSALTTEPSLQCESCHNM